MSKTWQKQNYVQWTLWMFPHIGKRNGTRSSTKLINNKNGIFGEVEDYLYRIEYQARGEGHTHTWHLWTSESRHQCRGMCVLIFLPVYFLLYTGRFLDRSTVNAARQMAALLLVHNISHPFTSHSTCGACHPGWHQWVSSFLMVHQHNIGYAAQIWCTSTCCW